METTICTLSSCDSYETIWSAAGVVLITNQILMSNIKIAVILLCHLVVKQKYTQKKAYFPRVFTCGHVSPTEPRKTHNITNSTFKPNLNQGRIARILEILQS